MSEHLKTCKLKCGFKHCTCYEEQIDTLELKNGIFLGVLADIAYSTDMTLEVIRSKAARIYNEYRDRE